MTTQTELELKPCPFCGGSGAFGTVKYAKSTLKEQKWSQDTFHFVNCINCGADTKGVVGHKTLSLAAESWNRRAAIVADRAKRDRLLIQALEHCLNWLPADCAAACEARAVLQEQSCKQ